MANPDYSRPAARIGNIRLKPGRQPEAAQERMVVTGGNYYLPGFKADAGTIEWVTVDEIIRRQGWDTYRDMGLDDQVKAALQFKAIIVAGRKLEVKPADGENGKEVAEFVRAELERVRIANLLKRSALCGFKYGFCVGELVWKLGEWKGKPVIQLQEPKLRDPRALTAQTDTHGNIEKWVQRGDRGQTIILPTDRVFHWAHEAEFGNPYGTSDLRAAYKNWWAKKYIVQFWNVFMERMGSPMTMMKYPQGAPSELKDTLKSILKGLSSRTELLVPAGVEVELIEATRGGNAGYLEALEYHDNAIARAVLVPALFGMGAKGERGSDSQSRLHLRMLFKMAAMLSDELSAALSVVVKRMVDYNFDVKEYPSLVWGDYSEFEMTEIVDAIRLMHAGGILELDETDTNYVRSVIGMSLRNEGEGDNVIRPPEPPPPGNANSPPPAAGQGNTRGAGRQGKGDTQNSSSNG